MNSIYDKTMKKLVRTFAVIMPLVASGQMRVPQIPKEDLAVTDKQAIEVFGALKAMSHRCKEVVFPIYSFRNRIAYGISIGEDLLIAKASEVAIQANLVTANKKGEAVRLSVVGAYPNHDLVVLSAPGLGAAAAEWADSSTLEEGSFLTAIRPDGEAQAMGVLSVHERSLRQADQGYLGVAIDPREMGEGVIISNVFRDSAAHKAGIRPGDTLLKIKGKIVKGYYEVSTLLRRLKVGEKPELLIVRDGKPRLVFPTLQGRQVQQYESRRMRAMDGEQNRVRSNFSNVLQSDMELGVEDTGLPVADLEGRIVGMVIARAGRISTLILPGKEMKELLSKKPQAIDMTPSRPVRRSYRSPKRMSVDEREELLRKLQDLLRGG